MVWYGMTEAYLPLDAQTFHSLREASLSLFANLRAFLKDLNWWSRLVLPGMRALLLLGCPFTARPEKSTMRKIMGGKFY